MNIGKVWEGWRNKLLPPKELRKLIKKTSEERMTICRECSYNSEVAKKQKMKIPFPLRPDEYCILCSCTLSAKTACLSCNCGIEDYNKKHPNSMMELKWEAVVTEEEDKQIENEINETTSGV